MTRIRFFMICRANVSNLERFQAAQRMACHGRASGSQQFIGTKQWLFKPFRRSQAGSVAESERYWGLYTDSITNPAICPQRDPEDQVGAQGEQQELAIQRQAEESRVRC